MLCCRVQNQLSAYADHELTGAEMLEIRGHLDGCPDCRLELDTLRRMKLLIRRLPEPAPYHDFSLDRVEARTRLGSRYPAPWLVPVARMWYSIRAWFAEAARLTPSIRWSATHLAAVGVLGITLLAVDVAQHPRHADAVSALVPASIAADQHPRITTKDMGVLFVRTSRPPLYYGYADYPQEYSEGTAVSVEQSIRMTEQDSYSLYSPYFAPVSYGWSGR